MKSDRDRHDALGDIDPTVAKLLEKRQRRQRQRFPSEEKRNKATWDLTPELIERIRDVSKELGVPQYALVEKLLTHSLDRYEDGELDLQRTPRVVSYTLQ